jgi:Dyp-type peroxidase family
VSGWETGDGSTPEEWVSIVPGRPGMIERLVVKPPAGSPKLVSDLRIAGEPVRFGGQIAECITVNLIGGVRDIGKAKDNVLLACTNGCCISAQDGAELGLTDPNAPPAGTIAALTPAGGYLPADTTAGRPLVLARWREGVFPMWRLLLQLGRYDMPKAKPKAPFRHVDAPQEPVLDMGDIQGIAVPGFLKPQHSLLYIRLPKAGPDAPHFLAAFRSFLREFLPSTAADTLADRRAHRDKHLVLKAVALSFQGLRTLVPDAAQFPSPAFRLGLGARSALLGDPTNPLDPGHVSNWQVGGRGKELDALLVFAGTSRDSVSAEAADTARALQRLGVDVESEEGGVRADLPGREHFGFDDGVSQPGIRGRASDKDNDFITPRYVDPKGSLFEASFFGYPGQALVWPGEFVLGYPASGPDPLLPGPLSQVTPGWTKNGSFLVFRRIRQDVAAFWNWIAHTRKTVKGLGGIQDDVALASRLVGRWPSGAPFNRTPNGDNQTLGKNAYENNNLQFDADTPDIHYVDKDGKAHGTIFPKLMAKADPAGMTCPWAAHKVNTRDSSSDTGAAASTYQRRLLRVGVAYGPPIKDNYKDDGVDRGLLFLSIQASIENQFEFLQARWMNDPMRPKAPAGHDMLVGQNAATEDGTRRCVLFPPGKIDAVMLEAPQQFVSPRGGGYFFLPSLSALRSVVGLQ